MDANIQDLIGKTMVSVTGGIGEDELVFTTDNGEVYKFFHEQDCCESVLINDITGELDALVGNPILVAEEVTNKDFPAPQNADSYTWTFYKFGTVMGWVDVRWLGESNGYYGEGVSFMRAK
jgi:hypothetical protein